MFFWAVVDRREGPIAVMEVNWGMEHFASDVTARVPWKEGTVYRKVGRSWQRWAAMERARRDDAAGNLATLKARDPGGDVRL